MLCYVFRLRLTTRDDVAVSFAPQKLRCTGCLSQTTTPQTTVTDGDSIVVDWHFAVDVANPQLRSAHDSMIQQTIHRRLGSKVPAISVKNLQFV
jgi:hypothetical protein